MLTKKRRVPAIDPNVKKLFNIISEMFEMIGEDCEQDRDRSRVKKLRNNFHRIKKKFEKPAILTSSAKGKGRNCQNWTAKKISELLNMPWGKDEVIAPREMGQSGVDIRLVADAKEQFPWSVECKWSEKWNVHNFIRQAKDNQKNSTDWLLILKKNRGDYVAVLDAEVFFDLLRLIKGKKGR